MNSCIYDCTVMHHRRRPVANTFAYRVFMFCIDLDEVDRLSRRLRLFSAERFNLFSLWRRDHIELGGATVAENVRAFLRSRGIEAGGGSVFLLTHLRTAGYLFNPVSFYLCFDGRGKPLCAVAEVGNTFRELKPYLLGSETFGENTFRKELPKEFYVSPFIDLDVVFDFRIGIPGDKLHIRIDDMARGERVLESTMTGGRRPLTDAQMLLSFLRVPFVTARVIALIHYQAAVLYLKKIPFHRKIEHPELQKDVFQWNR